MKVIVTGATGMVGKGVLLECLDNTNVQEVLSVSRKSLDMKHPKLKELLHQDFSEFDSIAKSLAGYDACYHCMGVSAAGLDEKTYSERTYGYSMALAETLFGLNPGMTFVYVSGQGTDSSEKGRTMWARVKGRTENAIGSLGFRQAFMFRPGAIIPLRGIRSATKLYQFFYDYFMWLIKLIKLLAPKSIVNTTQIGRAMLACTVHGYPKIIIDPRDILVLSDQI